MQFIDLTVPLNERTPIYPGDPPIKVEPAGVLARDGYADHYLSIGTHVGTHIDAPAHMVADGKTLDQYPVDHFIGRGVCLNMVNTTIDLNAVQQTDIRANDIVLFRTGMSNLYHEVGYFQNYPAMPEDVARYLVAQQIKIVGVDMCSVDTADSFPIHKILLSNDVLIIENLTNLDQLAGHDFTVYALPIKLEIDGAPARVIAELNHS